LKREDINVVESEKIICYDWSLLFVFVESDLKLQDNACCIDTNLIIMIIKKIKKRGKWRGN